MVDQWGKGDVLALFFKKKGEYFYIARPYPAVMTSRKNILPLAAMEKLLKASGADRVSEDAKEALRDVLEEHSLELGKKANAFAAHANRKTIKGADIRLANKQ